MTDTVKHAKLTHAGALKMIDAAIAKAVEINVPQCITVTDDGGRLLAFVRMDGAKFQSIESSHNKAITAASARVPTGGIGADVEMKLAHADLPPRTIPLFKSDSMSREGLIRS